MKKKILLGLLVIVALFTITGCGKSNGNGKESSNDNLHKSEFVEMRYNEPKNYSKKVPMDTDAYKVLVYYFNEDDKKTINLYYNTNTSLYSDEYDDDYEEVTISGFKWKKYHDIGFGVTYDTYMSIYNNALYTIELNEVDKYKDEFDEFMKDVSFE